MATRSNIGYENEDGTVTYCYCHWDGYPSYNGSILQDHYSYERTRKLVSLGDMSVLGRKYRKVKDHTFENPAPDTTVFYGRDRGEVDTEPRTNTYFGLVEDMQEYAYIVKPNNEWFVTSVHSNIGIWRPLKEVLKEQQ